jgi:hypothetical protein
VIGLAAIETVNKADAHRITDNKAASHDPRTHHYHSVRSEEALTEWFRGKCAPQVTWAFRLAVQIEE